MKLFKTLKLYIDEGIKIFYPDIKMDWMHYVLATTLLITTIMIMINR